MHAYACICMYACTHTFICVPDPWYFELYCIAGLIPSISLIWQKRYQRTDGPTDGPTDRRTDIPSYRDAIAASKNALNRRNVVSMVELFISYIFLFFLSINHTLIHSLKNERKITKKFFLLPTHFIANLNSKPKHFAFYPLLQNKHMRVLLVIRWQTYGKVTFYLEIKSTNQTDPYLLCVISLHP